MVHGARNHQIPPAKFSFHDFRNYKDTICKGLIPSRTLKGGMATLSEGSPVPVGLFLGPIRYQETSNSLHLTLIPPILGCYSPVWRGWVQCCLFPFEMVGSVWWGADSLLVRWWGAGGGEQSVQWGGARGGGSARKPPCRRPRRPPASAAASRSRTWPTGSGTSSTSGCTSSLP